jgi:hypothetical protein
MGVVMPDEKRSQPFCNIYEMHCKEAFEEIKRDVKDIKKVLIGNGDPSHSLVVQAKLNTDHREWMESWGRMIMASFTVTSFGFVGMLLWLLYAHGISWAK